MEVLACPPLSICAIEECMEQNSSKKSTVKTSGHSSLRRIEENETFGDNCYEVRAIKTSDQSEGSLTHPKLPTSTSDEHSAELIFHNGLPVVSILSRNARQVDKNDCPPNPYVWPQYHLLVLTTVNANGPRMSPLKR